MISTSCANTVPMLIMGKRKTEQREKNTKLQSWNTISEVISMPKDSPSHKGKNSGQTPTTTTGLNQSGQLEDQNQNHNTKKVALGPNTKR